MTHPLAAVMPGRRLVTAVSLLLLPLLLWGAVWLRAPDRPEDTVRLPAAPPRISAAGVEVPGVVGELLETGRDWRAARRLRAMVEPGSDPSVVLLAAKAEAGWGGWGNVRDLLEGEPWLDRTGGGDGWYLLGRALEEEREWAGAAAAYSRWLAARPAPGDTIDADRAVAELRRALALLRAGQTRAGVDSLARVRAHAPSIAGWIGVLAAEAVADRGDTARVRYFLGGGPSPSPIRALRARYRSHRLANDWRGARAAAVSAQAGLVTDAERAEARVLAARAALQLGDTAAAKNDLRAAVAAGSGEGAGLLVSLGGLSAAERLSVAAAFDRSDRTRAAANYRLWLSSGAGTAAERVDVRLKMGRALVAAGRWGEAVEALRPLADAPPAVASEASFLTGRAQYRQGSRPAAIATFLRTAERWPRTPSAAEALFLAADLSHDAGEAARSRALYRRVADEHPGSAKAGLALMRLGHLAFTARDYAAAQGAYEEYRRTTPTGPLWPQATYWAGRSLAARGDAAAAAARFREVRAREPLSYYAVLSAKRLNEAWWPIPLAAAPAEDAQLRGEVRRRMIAVDLLRAAGLHAEAVSEAERQAREAGEEMGRLYTVAEELNERGFTSQGIRIALRLIDGGRKYDARLLRILYPFPYRDIISAEARERGLDPFLVAALTRQESWFNARATSRVGARGLMQVMPETGRGMASSAGIRQWDPELLYNPEINVHLGTRFLAAQMRRWGQNLPYVFSAYNAGPGRVERWRTFAEARDQELFTERIPFEETREYVKILTRNTAVYRALYGR